MGPERSTKPPARPVATEALGSCTTPPGIHQKFGRAAHHEADVHGVALKGVVHDTEDLLEVLVSRLRTLEFVEIDHLIEHNEKSGIPGDFGKAGQRFE